MSTSSPSLPDFQCQFWLRLRHQSIDRILSVDLILFIQCTFMLLFPKRNYRCKVQTWCHSMRTWKYFHFRYRKMWMRLGLCLVSFAGKYNIKAQWTRSADSSCTREARYTSRALTIDTSKLECATDMDREYRSTPFEYRSSAKKSHEHWTYDSVRMKIEWMKHWQFFCVLFSFSPNHITETKKFCLNSAFGFELAWYFVELTYMPSIYHIPNYVDKTHNSCHFQLNVHIGRRW